MNENVDLTKILKDCPKGWEFYSSVYGEVKFLEISPSDQFHANEKDDASFMEEFVNELDYPVKLKVNICEYRVTKAGEHQKGVGECTLFPSKDQRDWSKFTAPWYKKDKFDPKTLMPFDKVLIWHCASECWSCEIFSHLTGKYTCNCIYGCYTRCMPYNDETKHLVGTTDEAPEYYRYWED
ncbi:MAG: hypothetical protein SOZ25_09810 [Prevotella sp.]|nr:hypothetical protein [Prevotella sp.]